MDEKRDDFFIDYCFALIGLIVLFCVAFFLVWTLEKEVELYKTSAEIYLKAYHRKCEFIPVQDKSNYPFVKKDGEK